MRIPNAPLWFLAILLLPDLAGAQPLDPELDKPYRLQVVLHVAENRFLTPVFQEQLQRALRDQLQLALGALANVEVVREHPLLREVEARGLESGLDGWEQITGTQTHFVQLDFSAGVYSLSARHYDGMTGLLSPAVRRAQTSERSMVAQAAARLVEQEFGLVGTVIETGKDVKLALKGGKLATRLERWLKPGEVFFISRITKEGAKLRGTRVAWALLEVVGGPEGGVCRCRLWHRFQADDLREVPGVLGYRCLKIATTPGPLKLRLIDDEQFKPLDGLQVHVLRPGTTKAAELTTNRDGLLVTRDSYEHMVLVRVVSGDTIRQFPVELTGERTVVCRLKIKADAETHAPLELRKDQWVRRILDNLRMASTRVADLNRDLSKSLTGALENARAGLKLMDSEIEHLAHERDQIVRLAGTKTTLDLREGDAALGALRKKKEDLGRFAVRIDEVLQESKSETTLGLAKLLERARLLEGEAEFDQAIALYEKVLETRPDQAKVKEHLAKLKADWATKGPKHAEARVFLIQTWPRLELAELQKNLDKARQALAVCKEAQDRLTPLKVIHANVLHGANLAKHLDTLKRQDTADNRTQAKVIAQVADGLRRVHAEATAAAGKKKE